jgi:hypothetical protein
VGNSPIGHARVTSQKPTWIYIWVPNKRMINKKYRSKGLNFGGGLNDHIAAYYGNFLKERVD